jgi:hypothetical protein
LISSGDDNTSTATEDGIGNPKFDCVNCIGAGNTVLINDMAVVVVMGGIVEGLVAVVIGGIVEGLVVVVMGGIVEGLVVVVMGGIVEGLVAVVMGGIVEGLVVVAVVMGGIVEGLVVVIGGIVEGLAVVMGGIVGGDIVTPEVYILLLLISWYWIFFSGSIIIPSIESSLTQDISLLYLVSSQ